MFLTGSDTKTGIRRMNGIQPVEGATESMCRIRGHQARGIIRGKSLEIRESKDFWGTEWNVSQI